MPRPRPSILTVAAAIVALTVAGCGSDSAGADKAAATSPASAAPPATTPAETATAAGSAAPAPPQGKTITVRIADGKVAPKSGRVSVARGERVRLVVTSDVADEVHIHGYGRELGLTPGKPATLEFTADQTGLFEVETHETKLILFQLLVR